jgi:hypothetical protein
MNEKPETGVDRGQPTARRSIDCAKAAPYASTPIRHILPSCSASASQEDARAAPQNTPHEIAAPHLITLSAAASRSVSVDRLIRRSPSYCCFPVVSVNCIVREASFTNRLGQYQKATAPTDGLSYLRERRAERRPVDLLRRRDARYRLRRAAAPGWKLPEASSKCGRMSWRRGSGRRCTGRPKQNLVCLSGQQLGEMRPRSRAVHFTRGAAVSAGPP